MLVALLACALPPSTLVDGSFLPHLHWRTTVTEAYGVYRDAANQQPCLLVTSINAGFTAMHTLWSARLKALGLKHLVVVQAPELHTIGDELQITFATNVSAESNKFRSPSFNSVSKNKIRIIYNLMARMQELERIWLCDPDILFFHDPYEVMKVHLTNASADATFMANGAEWTGVRRATELRGTHYEGNTGFYVVRNTAITRAVWRDWERADDAKLDDQTVFWNFLRPSGPISVSLFSSARFRHGQRGLDSNAVCSEVLVYHLNFVRTLQQKFAKMQQVTARRRELCGASTLPKCMTAACADARVTVQRAAAAEATARAEAKAERKSHKSHHDHGINATEVKERAVREYRENAKTKGAAWSSVPADAPSVAAAHSCLRQTTPALKLAYPNDAEAHFETIRLAMAPWAQHAAHRTHTYSQFSGPWIENEWITMFEKAYDGRRQGQRLSDFFGPYIPLFVPWTDLWVSSRYRYPAGLIDALLGVLRADVPYLTVSQNDEGLTGKCEFLLASHPNVLVLSAGGYGNVALPLFKQDEPFRAAKPLAVRKYLVSYLGSLDHAPSALRRTMAASVNASAKRLGFEAFVGRVAAWRDVMADSRASLCPRGFGRTSYHLVEAVQMGLLPVHVYLDQPWVPYPLIYETFGWATDIRGLPALLETLAATSADELARREKIVKGLRATHYTLNGTMQHIRGFLLGSASDLQCVKLPKTTKGTQTCLRPPEVEVNGAHVRGGKHMM